MSWTKDNIPPKKFGAYIKGSFTTRTPYNAHAEAFMNDNSEVAKGIEDVDLCSNTVARVVKGEPKTITARKFPIIPIQKT